MKMNPRQSAEFIVKNPKHIRVNEKGINKVADTALEAILSGNLTINRFSQAGFHPTVEEFGIERTLNWLLVCDTLNFCFWTTTDSPKWIVDGQSGYFALCNAITRAIKEGIDLTSAEVMSAITEQQMSHICRPDSSDQANIPLLSKRVSGLQQVGNVLLNRYQGQFLNVVKRADKSAKKLLDIIVSEFPSFKDEAIHRAQVVTFYKRAQILVGDIWACFKGESYGQFNDIGELTMFADYRVPQVLVHFEALEYNTDLNAALSSEIPLEANTDMECEIRGASIYIVEKIRDRILQRLQTEHPNVPTHEVCAVLIDHFLWDYRREHAKELERIPFHRVYSIFY